MDEALWTLLANAPAVKAICAQRVFWDNAPQGQVLPCIVLNVIDGADAPHLKGTDGLWRYTVQVDCYAASRPAALALSRAVVGVLSGHQNIAQGISGIFLTSTRSETDDAAIGRPARISTDFNIIWRN